MMVRIRKVERKGRPVRSEISLSEVQKTGFTEDSTFPIPVCNDFLNENSMTFPQLLPHFP